MSKLGSLLRDFDSLSKLQNGSHFYPLECLVRSGCYRGDVHFDGLQILRASLPSSPNLPQPLLTLILPSYPNLIISSFPPLVLGLRNPTPMVRPLHQRTQIHQLHARTHPEDDGRRAWKDRGRVVW